MSGEEREAIALSRAGIEAAMKWLQVVNVSNIERNCAVQWLASADARLSALEYGPPSSIREREK